jgi:hypothetical protein
MNAISAFTDLRSKTAFVRVPPLTQKRVKDGAPISVAGLLVEEFGGEGGDAFAEEF